MRSIRTDLAVEAHEYYTGSGQRAIAGVETEQRHMDGCEITRVKIVSKDGEEALHKPQGEYITVEIREMMRLSAAGKEAVGAVVGRQIRELLRRCGIGREDEILVVGLGNWDITPDALGPKTVSKLMVTRHLLEYMPEVSEVGVRSVCAVSPGVLGITGMETGEMVSGLIQRVKPKTVIAIDALAARSTKRIGITIQMSDTGISPGSGIGNRRKELTRHTLGIPVIAVGVPMVVDAATIAEDALESMVMHGDGTSFLSERMSRESEQQRYEQMRQCMGEELRKMMVTPKEVDAMVETISDVLREGIHRGIYSAEFLRHLS